jgi:hypothetical protein
LDTITALFTLSEPVTEAGVHQVVYVPHVTPSRPSIACQPKTSRNPGRTRPAARSPAQTGPPTNPETKPKTNPKPQNENQPKTQNQPKNHKNPEGLVVR